MPSPTHLRRAHRPRPSSTSSSAPTATPSPAAASAAVPTAPPDTATLLTASQTWSIGISFASLAPPSLPPPPFRPSYADASSGIGAPSSGVKATGKPGQLNGLVVAVVAAGTALLLVATTISWLLWSSARRRRTRPSLLTTTSRIPLTGSPGLRRSVRGGPRDTRGGARGGGRYGSDGNGNTSGFGVSLPRSEKGWEKLHDDRYKADAPSSSGGTSLTFPRTAPTRPTAPTAKPPPASPYPYEDIFPPSVAEPPPTHSHPSSPHLRRPAAATAAERDSVLDHYYDLETYRDRSVSPTTLASFPSPPPVAARFA